MITASFSDIRKKIQKSIDQAQNNISVAVAWFTSKDLLGQLTDKIEAGCKVEIIISDHTENQRLSFDKFIAKGGCVDVLPTKSGRFLHDKFAIFDRSKLIAGSYNWTNSAEYYNHEFIIQSNEEQLVKQFSIRFNNLKKVVTEYDRLKLLSSDNLTAETKEIEFLRLEDDLEKEFIDAIHDANNLGAKINATNVFEYIHNYGAIGGANRLIKSGTDRLQSGLIKLWEINRLDLSFESIISKDKYKVLFEKEILENARIRLNELSKK